MSRMLRNLVGVKPDARNEDLKRYVRAWCELFFAPHHQNKNQKMFCSTLLIHFFSSYDSSFSQFSIRVTSPRSRHTYNRSYPSMITRCVSIPCLHACVYTLPFLSLAFRDVWSMQVVLADKYDSYRMTYEGCHVFNPGRFIGRSLGFSTYTPASRESEAWYVIHVQFIYPSLGTPFPSRFAPRTSGTEKQQFHFQRRGLGSRDLTRLTVYTDPTKIEGTHLWLGICSY